MSFSQGLRGVRVWVHALGCRASLCEGDALACALEAAGAHVSSDPSGCRAALIVSCSVTAEADRKCRQIVRRARRAVGDDGIVAVCGCWAQGLDASSAEELGIDILSGSRGKSLVPDAMERALISGRSFTDIRRSVSGAAPWEELPMSAPKLHTRAFIKVQDGCSRFCAYCIIPSLRGRPVSRPVESVIDEVRRVAEAGCSEAVLTGIHLGIYGCDTGSSLAELIEAVASDGSISRLRLGSLEPFSLNGRLLDALAGSGIFCPHLHLPMQSGDDRVLRIMGRGHTAADFVRVCDEARKRLGGDLHISTDVMAGFPGEDEAAFQNTLSVMREAGIGRAHVFPFSPRQGTRAAVMDGQVAHDVKTRRAAEASALGAELLNDYAERFAGRVECVLAEGVNDGIAHGHTPHFLEAEWPAAGVRPGETANVRILSASEGRLAGCMESGPAGGSRQ